MPLTLHILGSGAGGGVPQWNCRCPICERARAGDPMVKARTQSSIAVTLDGARYLLINASPDIRQQMALLPALHPREGLRHTPLAAALVTNADVDHIAGLLSLRESEPFALYASAETQDALAQNGVFDVVNPTLVPRRTVALDVPVEPLPGLSVTLFAVPGKVALWQERGEPVVGETTGTTVGVLLKGEGRRIAYVPGCAEVTDAVRERLAGGDVLLFDGTVYEDDDMIRAGVGTKTGRRMGHVPMTGPEGSVARLTGTPLGRRIFVHINNTNPVLVEDSLENEAVRAAGWELAHDGMEITP
ncbi:MULTISPECIES: pyrroloquinoline quinone biosynthesis protein PqqB [Xanthobacter]|uniref:pyrroloquinoline quinone biosynthesis protein PqqB n=1 Tax=Xanthobacter TaxID=279 RepID=UPI0024A6FA29|nr:pyrroloquinoline quinone biosynthesis protein PqqB [Xanthobacter autotrophicus]MDI4657386.1 pyrroloquinoline quinone biosynthesis protein PqqB [Xanthobacter autotrophicus]MDI4665516.1 pyrroloquinoline quinone biosynthesis protein PqqB [Xanthobacter autotrophicus]